MQNPFSMFDNMMSNVRNKMEEMHRNFVSVLRQTPTPDSLVLLNKM